MSGQQMKAVEKFGLKGRLKIDVFNLPEDFNRKDYFDKSQKISIKYYGKKTSGPDMTLDFSPNVIVNTGRERVLEVVSGLTTDAFTEMAIGDDGASSIDILIPVAPTISDTDLENKLATQTISSTTVTSSGSPAQFFIEYIETFTAGDFLGSPGLPFLDPSKKIVNECGLFTPGDATMLARKTFPSIPFDPATAIAIKFTWDIIIN